MTPYLPPGFRFNPSPLELIRCYLQKMVLGEQLPYAIIEGEIYGDDAQLPEADDIGDRELHMFVKIKKNQNGTKTKRMTKNGYWKVTGNKKEIKDKGGNHIGTTRPLELVETNKSGKKRQLLMDEYTLDGSLKNVINPEGWVICKIKQSKISPRRGKSQAEEGHLVIYEDDEFWAPIQDNHSMAECPSQTSGGPSHMWLDQSGPTPTEPPTNGGNDYNSENPDDLRWADGLMDIENYPESISGY